MKAVTVFMMLAIVSQLTHADNVNHFEDDLVSESVARSIGDKIKELLESFKETLKTGDESKGIPPMDPFNLKHQEINVEHEIVTATGEVNDLYVKGISDFEVQQADFKLAKKNFSIKLMWPNIKGNSLYDILEAKFADVIPFFGKGDAKFEVANLTFATNAKLKLDLKNKNATIIEFTNTKILLHALKVDATGLYNDDQLSEFISGVISDLAPQTLVDFQKKFTAQVNEIMLDMANQILPSVIGVIWGIIMP